MSPEVDRGGEGERGGREGRERGGERGGDRGREGEKGEGGKEEYSTNSKSEPLKAKPLHPPQ